MNNPRNEQNAPHGDNMRLYVAITKAYAENVRMMREELRRTQRAYRRTRALLWLTYATAAAALILSVWIARTY